MKQTRLDTNVPDDSADNPGRMNEVVPLFGTWRTAYVSVTAAFLVDVALFYAFSRYFS